MLYKSYDYTALFIIYELINWKELIVLDIVDEIYYGDIVDTELDESQVHYMYWFYYEDMP